MRNKMKKTTEKENATPASSKTPASFNFRPYVLFLFCLSLFTFLNSYKGDYVLDDSGIINYNKQTTAPISFENFQHIISSSYRDGTPGNFENELYRPLTKSIFNVVYQVGGNDPTLFHLLNILLYALLVGMMCMVLLRIFRNYYVVAILSALLFAVHPIHCESVANIKGLEEILSLLFILLSLYSALNYEQQPLLRSLIGSIVFFTLALFSKESSVLGLLLIPLSIFYAKGKLAQRKLSLGLAASAGFFLICRYAVLSHYDHIHVAPSKLDNIMYFAIDGNTTNWPMRLGTAFFLQAFAVYKMVWPLSLSCDYNYAGITTKTFTDWQAWAGLILYFGMIFLAWKTYKKNKLISFGLSWYLISGLLTNNLFLVIGTGFGDRLMFTPGLGLIVAFVGLFGLLFKYQPEEANLFNLQESLSKNKLLWMTTLLLAIPLAKLSYSRNYDWSSNKVLFTADLKTYPDVVKIQRSLAQTLSLTEAKSGVTSDSVIHDNTLAIQYFKNAYRLFPQFMPDDWYLYGKCYFNLYFIQGHNENHYLDSAEKLFKIANRLGYAHVSCESDLARIYFLKYRNSDHNKAFIDTAIFYGMNAYHKNPKDITLTKNIGAFYGPLGKLDSGIIWLERAWALDSTSSENITTAGNMAKFYETLGKPDLAKLWLEKADRLQRGNE